MKRKFQLVIFVIVVLSILSIACYCPPPHAHCSPGFWKNRGHTIYGAYDDSDLYAKGPGSDAIRHAFAEYMNYLHPDADCYCMD